MSLIVIVLLVLSIAVNALLGYALVCTDKKRKLAILESTKLKSSINEHIESTSRSMDSLRRELANLQGVEADYKSVLEQLQEQVKVNEEVTRELETAKKKLSRKGCNKKVKG